MSNLIENTSEEVPETPVEELTEQSSTVDDEEQTVTPWEVTSKDGINYMKLIQKFGCSPIDGKLIKRWEQVTRMRAHTFLRRGLYFSQQDLEKVLDCYEKKEEIYLYTGRGPTSESMHLGHMLPFMFTKYLQDALDCIVVIQMSDDEKFFFKGGDPEEYYRLSRENSKDVIACGFNPEKTYIFSNMKSFGGALYHTEMLIAAKTTGNQIRGIYGLDLNNTVGQIGWPSKQCAPAFSKSFPFIFGDRIVPCLVPMAIDQAPYFRMARDFGQKMGKHGYLKPATIHTKFLPALEGANEKMSSTGKSESIYLTYTEKQIRKAINKHAHSGGRGTVEEHRRLGGRLDVDMAFQYMLYFEDDDAKMAQIARDYTSGKLLSGEVKKMMADVVVDLVMKHQSERVKVTEEVIDHFFNPERKNGFDHTFSERPELELYPDEVYQGYGLNFDTEFGTTSAPVSTEETTTTSSSSSM